MKINKTRIIGRIVAMYFLVTGIGFLVSADYYSHMIAHTGSDPVLINLSGMVHFFIGMTILALHFRWRRPLQIAVTIAGFFFLLKGVALIAVPGLTLQTGNNPAQIPLVMSIAFMAVGVALGYFSFFGKKDAQK